MKFKEIIDLNDVIGHCTTKGLSINSIIALLDIKKKIEECTKKYEELFSVIMSNNNIKNENNSYSWKDLPNEKEITKEIVDLLDFEVEIVFSNLIDLEDIIKMSEGQSINVLSFLTKFLVK